MHPQYIRAPSKNLAPHLWRLHRLKKSTKGGGARRGREQGRGQRWTPDQEGPRGRRVSLLRPDPRPRLGSAVSRSSRNSGGAEAGRGSAAPGRSAPSAVLAGAVSAEAERGRHGHARARAPRSPPPAQPAAAPAPAPSPPARRAGGRRAERFQMWRGGGGGGARRPGARRRAHGADRAPGGALARPSATPPTSPAAHMTSKGAG